MRSCLAFLVNVLEQLYYNIVIARALLCSTVSRPCSIRQMRHYLWRSCSFAYNGRSAVLGSVIGSNHKNYMWMPPFGMMGYPYCMFPLSWNTNCSWLLPEDHSSDAVHMLSSNIKSKVSLLVGRSHWLMHLLGVVLLCYGISMPRLLSQSHFAFVISLILSGVVFPNDQCCNGRWLREDQGQNTVLLSQHRNWLLVHNSRVLTPISLWTSFIGRAHTDICPFGYNYTTWIMWT